MAATTALHGSPHTGLTCFLALSLALTRTHTDAQYDGQIVKSTPEQEATENNQANEENQQQQQQTQSYYATQQDLNRLNGNSRPHDDHAQQHSDNEQQHQQQVADGYQQQQPQQQQQHQYTDQMSTPANEQQPQQARDGYMSTSSYGAGAQLNHHSQAPSNANYEQQQQFDSNPQSPTIGQYSYVKLDRDRQQNHLEQHQAQHQAQIAEIMNSQQPQQEQQYKTTTPMTLTTLAVAIEQQEATQAQQEQEQQGAQQQQQVNSDNSNAYTTEQVQSRPSVQSQPESLLVNESPMQVPILDQQSLIADSNQESGDEISDDDGAKQRQQSQPAGVYQVYQAYYAPKDHKPLPGYVRLSLDEFNELFRDAEIQYVDRNLNGLTGQQNLLLQTPQQQQQIAPTNGYEQMSNANDHMKASSSDVQSILVDGRSISERRSSNSNATQPLIEPKTISKIMSSDRKSKLGQAVKKIISIRNSRQLAKQMKNSKLVMKRVKPQFLSGPGATTDSTIVANATLTTESARKIIAIDKGDTQTPLLKLQKSDKNKTDVNNNNKKSKSQP